MKWPRTSTAGATSMSKLPATCTSGPKGSGPGAGSLSHWFCRSVVGLGPDDVTDDVARAPGLAAVVRPDVGEVIHVVRRGQDVEVVQRAAARVDDQGVAVGELVGPRLEDDLRRGPRVPAVMGHGE